MKSLLRRGWTNRFVGTAVAVLGIAGAIQAAPPTDTCKQETWLTNGLVNAIVPAGDKIYIGGRFTRVGPYTGCGVPVNASTGAPAATYPKVNGTVYAVCADGSGGWFIGGSFSLVGGVARRNLAHIISGGSVDA